MTLPSFQQLGMTSNSSVKANCIVKSELSIRSSKKLFSKPKSRCSENGVMVSFFFLLGEREGGWGVRFWQVPVYLLDCDPKKDAQFACRLLCHSISVMPPLHYFCKERLRGSWSKRQATILMKHVFTLLVSHTCKKVLNPQTHHVLLREKVPIDKKFTSIIVMYQHFSFYFFRNVPTLDIVMVKKYYLLANCTNPHPFPVGILTETISPYCKKGCLRSSSLTLGSSPPTNI